MWRNGWKWHQSSPISGDENTMSGDENSVFFSNRHEICRGRNWRWPALSLVLTSWCYSSCPLPSSSLLLPSRGHGMGKAYEGYKPEKVALTTEAAWAGWDHQSHLQVTFIMIVQWLTENPSLEMPFPKKGNFRGSDHWKVMKTFLKEKLIKKRRQTHEQHVQSQSLGQTWALSHGWLLTELEKPVRGPLGEVLAFGL